MTKRDFELIAKTVLKIGADGALCMDNASDRVALAEQFAIAIATTNPRFDSQRFIAAATTPEDLADALEEASDQHA